MHITETLINIDLNIFIILYVYKISVYIAIVALLQEKLVPKKYLIWLNQLMSDLFEKMIEYFAAFWTDPGNLFLFFPFF